MPKQVTLPIIFKSILTWSIVATIAMVYNVIAVLLIWAPVKTRHRIISSWASFYIFCTKYICGITYTVSGTENIITGPAIIASNHQSMWETSVFVNIFPQHIWILKRELLWFPIFGWTVSLAGPIAINRTKARSALQQMIKQATQRIHSGFWILVFPEGTRVPPGINKKYKNGVAKLAQALNLPIIPVAHNAGYVLPKSSFWLRPGKVTIIIDKVIYPHEYASPDQLTLHMQDVITRNLSRILH